MGRIPLFESVEGGERFGRYSIIGLPARCVLRVRPPPRHAGTWRSGRITPGRGPLAKSSACVAYSVPKIDGLPGFTGGLVGWFGFECVEYIEPRLGHSGLPDELGTPDILLMLSEELAVFDSLKGRLYLIVHADPSQPQAWAQATRRLDALEHRLRHAAPCQERCTARRWMKPISSTVSPVRASSTRAPGLHPRRRRLPGGETSAEHSIPCARSMCIARCAANPPHTYFSYRRDLGRFLAGDLVRLQEGEVTVDRSPAPDHAGAGGSGAGSRTAGRSGTRQHLTDRSGAQ